MDSTRKLSVYRWPEVLVIHLKRFSYIGFGSKKLNNDISFGRQMNLNAFADAGVFHCLCIVRRSGCALERFDISES